MRLNIVLFYFSSENVRILIYIFIFIAILLALLITYALVKRFYYKKIENNSKAICELQKINNEFTFNVINNHDLIHSYDNENYYNMISPKDYLTYQLVYNQKQVSKSISLADENRIKYIVYSEKVKQIQFFDEYSCLKKPRFERLRKRVEQKIFNMKLYKPTTYFCIEVCLILTKINGSFRRVKKDRFNSEFIKDVISRLNNRYGNFYLDPSIWESICNVERGKVSNKMRFAVYKRDGNRCRKCGSRFNLEVDHIYPISKGGKTTFDNLQTLCHNCNVRKSNTIEDGVKIPNVIHHSNSVCPRCGKPLVIRNGKNGKFKGCSGYPNCRYTEKI